MFTKKMMLLGVLAASMLFAFACGPAETESTATPTSSAQPANTATPSDSGQGSPGDGVKEVPRNRTLVAAGNWTDEPQNFDKWNPYHPAGTFQRGTTFFFEPLYYYNGLGDRTYEWLATGFSYNQDSTELTYNLRPGVTWSDGEEFNADDVVFTINSLRDLGSEVPRNGTQIQDFVNRAEAVDNLTVRIIFNRPAPKFHDFVVQRGDSGLFIVPEHNWNDVVWPEYTGWRDGAGPITTSPWRLAFADGTQRIVDRVETCDEWWACRTGFSDLPEVERFVLLTNLNETQYVQGVIEGIIDTTHDTQPDNSERALSQNPDVTTWSGDEGPYGLVSWWPTSVFVNHDDPHLGNSEVRRAINHYINRDQVVTFGLSGNGLTAIYPWPDWASMKPYEEDIEDVTRRYGLGEHNPDTADNLLETEGYSKNSGGLWEDSSGSTIRCEILGSAPHFTGSGPVLAQQLRDSGIDASYTLTTDRASLIGSGNYTCFMSGHNGGHKDPYQTLGLYRSGEGLTGQINYSNPELDALYDRLGTINPTQNPDEFRAVVKEAMTIWIQDIPDIPVLQFLNSPIRSERYWTNWPTRDNPYMNGLFLHTGFPYTLLQLKATNAQ